MSILYPNLPNTMFPNNIDTFKPFKDITQGDYQLLTQYQNAVESGDMATATTVLNQIPLGRQKLISALNMNELREGLLATEQFYKSDVAPYTAQKQTEWQNIINRFSYVGIYSTTVTYVKNNIVMFINNGLEQLYLNTYDGATPQGTSPLDINYWRVFTIRGAKGDPGVGANFSFKWDSATPYTTNTIVVYDNSWWNALKNSTNQQPYDGSPYWTKVLDITQAPYPVQEIEPATLKVNEIWFKVLV